MIAVIVAFVTFFGVLISHFGLVNPLPDEQHIERDRASSRMVITEDKDGCVDMRTLGRSNGVYMSIKPCKPGDKSDKKDDSAK